MNHSEYLATQGIPNNSFLPLDRNVAIKFKLLLYGNATRTQGEVKINATASVRNEQEPEVALCDTRYVSRSKISTIVLSLVFICKDGFDNTDKNAVNV